LKGEIAELFVFYGQLSPAERRAVKDYLGARYFPLSVTEQPKEVYGIPTRTASFAVSAHAGPAAVQYQWQRRIEWVEGADFEDLPGETNATYSLVVTFENVGGTSGASYRVKILSQDQDVLGFSDAARLWLVVVDGERAYAASRLQFSPNTVHLAFEGYLDESLAKDISKYSIDQGVQVLSVRADIVRNVVELDTSGLDESKSYTITYGYLSGFLIPNADQIRSTIELPPWNPNLSLSFLPANDGSYYVIARWQEFLKARSLEVSDGLEAVVWKPVETNPIRGIGGYTSVTVGTSNSASYFRLR
jgi:hypothetical protein